MQAGDEASKEIRLPQALEKVLAMKDSRAQELGVDDLESAEKEGKISTTFRSFYNVVDWKCTMRARTGTVTQGTSWWDLGLTNGTLEFREFALVDE